MISLLYHDVISGNDPGSSGFPGADADIYKFPQLEFERHLQAITPVSSGRQLIALKSRHQEIPSDALSFTFDDGGASSMLIADLLEARGWRGHFFIPTDYLGEPAFLNATQIRELHMRGHVIGSHSCSHPARISHCRPAELDHEWRDSVRILSECLGERVQVASVPGGFYAPRVAKAASDAGIEILFTSEPTSRIEDAHGCMIIGRYSIQQGISAETAARIARGDALPRFQQQFSWSAKKLLKRIGGNYYLAMRKKILENDHSA